MKTVAIDFDGVLVEDLGDDTIRDPDRYTVLDGARETIQYLKDEQWEVVVYTARDWHSQYLINDLLTKAGILVHGICCGTKPKANLYIDDKALRFESWPNTRSWLKRHMVEKNKRIGQQPIEEFEQTLRDEKVERFMPNVINSILDVGCGDGSTWSREIRKRIGVLDGVDTDLQMRIRARESGFHAVYENLFELPEDFTYSLVTCFGVLEHVDAPSAFLHSLKRFDNIVLTVPNADSFHRIVGQQASIIKLRGELGPADLDVGHKRYYSYRPFLLLMAEFASVHGYGLEVGTIGFKVSSNAMMAPFYDIAPSINAAATQLGWVGKDAEHGAELYAKLWR